MPLIISAHALLKFFTLEIVMAQVVMTHAGTATQTNSRPIDPKNGNCVASERRNVATEYMPSGNTRLHKAGLYESGIRQTACFHTPKQTRSGIHHVPQAHTINVTPSMNGFMLVK